MFAIHGLLVGQSVVSAGKVLTYLGIAGGNGPYTGLDFGTPSSDRRIIAFLAGNGTGNFSTVTIGGVSADIVAEVTGRDHAVLAVAHVPSGATGTISETGQANIDGGIGWWSVTGLTNSVAVDTGTDSGATSSVILSTLSGGFIVAGCVSETNADPTATGSLTRLGTFDDTGDCGGAVGLTDTDGSNTTVGFSGMHNNTGILLAASF